MDPLSRIEILVIVSHADTDIYFSGRQCITNTPILYITCMYICLLRKSHILWHMSRKKWEVLIYYGVVEE